MVTQLVTNGCSYMTHQAMDGGIEHLADLLGISNTQDISRPGNSNQSIIRTTLEHSLQTDQPTLYVVSITYLPRLELPVALHTDQWSSGRDRWLNITNTDFDQTLLKTTTTKHEIMDYVDLKHRIYNDANYELVRELFRNLRMLIDSVKARGHSIAVFNSAEERVVDCFNTVGIDEFAKFDSVEFIDQLSWLSNQYQYDNGLTWDDGDEKFPLVQRHVRSGQYKLLNNFLVDYINKHCII
jgi:hypothetical protein